MESNPQPINAPQGKPKTFKRVAWGLCAAAVVGLLVGPTVVANVEGLRNGVVGAIFAKVDGRVTADGGSMGWFSPIVLYGVQAVDSEGREVLTAERLEIDRTLLNLLFRPLTLGNLEIERPVLRITSQKSGDNNLSRAFGPLVSPEPEPDGPKNKRKVAVSQVRILDGRIHFQDLEAGLVGQVDQVTLTLNVGPDQPPAVDFHIIGDLSFTQPDMAPFYEQPLRLTAVGKVDPKGDLLELSKLAVHPRNGPLNVEGSGQVAALSSQPELTIDGVLNYQLSILAERLRPWIGGDLDLQGQGARPFHVSGPLPNNNQPAPLPGDPPTDPPTPWIEPIKADVELGWTSARCYGVEVGEAALTGKLEQGWLHVAARQVSISQGTLDLRTRLHLDAEKPLLVVEPGRIVDHVRVTDDVCAQGLKFIAPVLAETTRAHGAFSLDFTRCELPLHAAEKPVVEGRLVVHSLDVRPSPLTTRLAELLRLPADVRLVDESVVSFILENDRMQHAGLVFHLGKVRIESSGSVGLDQSLAMLLELPVPEHWLGTGALADRLRGQSLRIPVSGTLQKPVIDMQAMADANVLALSGPSGELLRGLLNKEGFSWPAAGGAVLDLLERRATGERPILDLFRPRSERRPTDSPPAEPAPTDPPPSGPPSSPP